MGVWRYPLVSDHNSSLACPMLQSYVEKIEFSLVVVINLAQRNLMCVFPWPLSSAEILESRLSLPSVQQTETRPSLVCCHIYSAGELDGRLS